MEISYREDYKIDVGGHLRNAWQILSVNIGLFIGFTAIYLALNIALSFIPILGSVVTVLISGPLTAGLFIATLKILRNEELEFNDFFQGFNFFLPLLLLSLVMGILISLGIILLIIPGIYLSVSYTFAMLIVVDKQMDFWAAMEYSRKVVGKNFFGVLGLVLVLGLINLAGVIALGVGILLTIPLTAIVTTIAYSHIFMVD